MIGIYKITSPSGKVYIGQSMDTGIYKGSIGRVCNKNKYIRWIQMGVYKQLNIKIWLGQI